jgi:hypothetical protein
MAQVHGTNLDSKCAVCDNIVEITEGAVLFDTKWYHQKCWDIGGKNGQSNSS